MRHSCVWRERPPPAVGSIGHFSHSLHARPATGTAGAQKETMPLRLIALRLIALLLSLQPTRTRRRGAAPPAAPPPPHTALLVRGYNPTEPMIRRWTSFAQSCRAAEPRVVFAVSLDVTNRSREADFDRLAPVKAEGAGLHAYTEGQLVRRYPGLRAVERRYAELTGGGAYKVRKRTAIEPALMLVAWLRRERTDAAGLARYWILEQDVACSAPTRIAAGLLYAYSADGSDLIVGMQNESRFVQKQARQGSTGLHSKVASPEWLAAFPDPSAQLRTAPMFVQRWSARLADVIAAAADASRHAWAEIMPPSLARAANLTTSSLRAEHRGALFHACCTRHVKVTSQNFLPDERKFVLRTNQSEVRLFHPVKF